MAKDIMKISTVSLKTAWGDKDANLKRILGYMEGAAAEGANMVVLPEMALTGYDDQSDVPRAQKMQTRLSEPVPGPSSNTVAAKARELGIFVAFGLPEQDAADPTVVYNSVCVCGPEGIVGTYRKTHLPNPEMNWAVRGEDPFLFDTPWGPVGLAICYDIYCFPELTRYYAAKGCRVILNCTAIAQAQGSVIGSTTLEAGVITNEIYLVSSNITGTELVNDFLGGASIIGPSVRFWEPEYYAGFPFAHDKAIEAGMYSALVDLSLAVRSKFEPNPLIDGATDFRPALYRKLYDDLLQDPKFQEPSLAADDLASAAGSLIGQQTT